MADPGQDAICAHAGLQNQQINPGRGSATGSTSPVGPLLRPPGQSAQGRSGRRADRPAFVQGSSFTSVASSVSTIGL